MTRRYLKWTEETVAHFLDLCRRNVPRDAIAAELGWDHRAVTRLDRWLRMNGRQPYRLALHTVRNSCLLGREAEIAKLSREGLSAGQIAKRFGVSKNTVAGMMDRHGLYAPQRLKRNGRSMPQSGRPMPPAVSLARCSLPHVEYDEADLRAGRALMEACG